MTGFTYVSTATALTSYKILGTAEAGATVSVSNGGAAPLGTAIAAADGTWSLNVTPNPTSNFSNLLTATATDVAGNTGVGGTGGVAVGTAAANTLPGPSGTGANLLLGLAGNDVLTGGSGNDLLDGGTGADNMIGGAGDDSYVVDNVGDRVTEAANGGTDTVLASLGTYILTANVENLSYTGVANFTGTGNNLANVIKGGTGNDTLAGGVNDPGAGADTLIGGAGNDTYVISNALDVITELAGGGTDTVQTALGSYTLAVGSNLENLTHTGATRLHRHRQRTRQRHHRRRGADTLDGGKNTAGVDTLVGGAGNDTYLVRNVGDVVTEAAGGGTDTVQSFLNTYTLSANVENLTFAGIGDFTGTGNNLSNIITGGSGNDTLDGGAGGRDTLIGGAGDDTYIVRNATDVVTEAAGGGIDTVKTALATYTLTANVENLTYTGAAGFTGTGNALANFITGGTGADTLSDGGVGGADTLIGGAGNDTYIVNNATDVIVELAGGGTDTVRANVNTYTLADNVENLIFIGTGAFTGTGNAQANTITGGAGNDTLAGGGGADTLRGGGGADVFVMVKGDANGDLIADFTRAQGDTITLTGYAAGSVLVRGANRRRGDLLRRAKRRGDAGHVPAHRQHYAHRRHRLQVRLTVTPRAGEFSGPGRRKADRMIQDLYIDRRSTMHRSFDGPADSSTSVKRSDLFRLSERETEAAMLFLAGFDLKESSIRMGLNKTTVRTHLKNAMLKANSLSKQDLFEWLLRL